MLKEIKEKEFNRINNMIDSYTTDINDLVKQAEKVDEKYRKLAEEEQKDIKEALQYYRGLREELIARRDSLGVEAAVVDKKTTAKKLKEAEEKEEVTDMLFPENNEEEVVEPVKDQTEEPEQDLDAEEDADWEEKIESGELTKVEPEETVEVEDVWDEAEEEEPEQPEEEEESEDEGWPDVVEEWN